MESKYKKRAAPRTYQAPGGEVKTKVQELVDKVESYYGEANDHLIRARNHLTFLYVDQWEPGVRQSRERIGKPTLQFNRLVPLVRGILGEQRNSTPDVAIRDISQNLDPGNELVDIYTGLTREISYCSDADIVYQLAFKQMLECGWGTGRVCIEEEEPGSFEKVIRIHPILDYQAAFWDPAAQSLNRLDGDFCGVHEVMVRDTYERLYPDYPVPISMTGGAQEYYLPWNNVDFIVIAEIYLKEYFKRRRYKMSNGMVLDEDEYKQLNALQEKMVDHPMIALAGFEPLTVVEKKEFWDYKIKHYKFVQNYILEETDWPGKMLPIPYMEGDSVTIDGRRIPLPFVTEAIDEQKLVNVVGSEIAYAVMRARKETIFATPDNVKGFEEEYANPDQVQGHMPYNPDSQTGAAPVIQAPPIISEQLLEIQQQAIQGISETTGRFEESRGEQSNAISRVAIAQRQIASKKPVNVYEDNLARLIKDLNCIVVELIPHVYDNERIVSLRAPDAKTKKATVNQVMGYQMNGVDEDPEPIIKNDLKKGKYDVEVRVDGSFDQQQSAALNFLLNLMQSQAVPPNLIADLMAKYSGLENTQQLVKRLETLVPPQILAEEKGEPPPPPPPPPAIPPEVQVQMQKLEVEKQQTALKAKQMVLDEQKMIIEAQQAGIDTEAALAKAHAEITRANTTKDIALINHATAVHKAGSAVASQVLKNQQARTKNG